MPTPRLEDPISRLEDPISRLEDPISRLEDPISRLEDPISRLETNDSRPEDLTHKRPLTTSFHISPAPTTHMTCYNFQQITFIFEFGG